MNSVAEKISSLIAAPLVAVFSYRLGEAAGIKSTECLSSETVKREGLADYLRTQIKQAFGSDTELRSFTLSESDLRLPLMSSIQTLTYVPIVGASRNDPSSIHYYGAIALGTTHPLSSVEEIALLAIAQKLHELCLVTDLERTIQIRTQFLSIASHELKTPLTSIYGILQLQERMMRVKKDPSVGFADQERHHNFLKMVIRQVERLNELIDALLDVSRIQSGRFMIEPSEADISSILKEIIQTRLNVIAQEASVKLQTEISDSIQAWVDPVRMEEIFSNLVMNAIRFSPEGGIVWISLRPDGDAFRFTVRDQGPSVPIEDQERIFQPFERAERTSRFGGLGLGLFISREIAQLHGGNVNLIESVPGKGNRFEAYLPTRSHQLAAASGS